MKSLLLVILVFVFLSGCAPTISNFNSPVQPITSPTWLEYAPYSAKEITAVTISADLFDQTPINQISKIICDTVVTQQGDDLLKKYTCEQSGNHGFDAFSMTATMTILGELLDVSLINGTLDSGEVESITKSLIEGVTPVINNPIVSGKSIFKSDMSNFLDLPGIEDIGDISIDEIVRGWSTYNGIKVLVVDSMGTIAIKVPDSFNGNFSISGYKLIDPTTMAILKSEGSAKGKLSIGGEVGGTFEILSSTHLDSYSPTDTPVLPEKTSSQSLKKSFDEAVSAYDTNDFDQALKKWLPLAAKGHPESAFRLADMYDFALGVEQDYQQAAMWYLAAAQRGHGEAQCKIANRYSSGLGIQVNREEAYRWSWLCSENKASSETSVYYAKGYMRAVHTVGTLSSAKIQEIESHARAWRPKPALSLTKQRSNPTPIFTMVKQTIKPTKKYKYIGETTIIDTLTNGDKVAETIRTYLIPTTNPVIANAQLDVVEVLNQVQANIAGGMSISQAMADLGMKDTDNLIDPADSELLGVPADEVWGAIVDEIVKHIQRAAMGLGDVDDLSLSDSKGEKIMTSGVQIFSRKLKTGYWLEDIFAHYPNVIRKNKINVGGIDYQQIVFIGKIMNKKFFQDKGYHIPEELIVWGISEDLGIHDNPQIIIFYAEDLTTFFDNTHRKYNDIFPRDSWLNSELHSQRQKEAIRNFILRARQSISLFSEEER